MNRWVKAAWLIGVWGMLMPTLSAMAVVALMEEFDFQSLADWVKNLVWANGIVLGWLGKLLYDLHDIRDMKEITSRARGELNRGVDWQVRRVRWFMMLVVVTGVVCFSAPMAVRMDDPVVRFSVLFLAGNSLFVTGFILLATIAIMFTSRRLKSGIIDEDRKQKRYAEELEALRKDANAGYVPSEKLTNRTIQWPTSHPV